MGSKGLGPLLPRDFLERQPKRWQKSQRKRGAVRALIPWRRREWPSGTDLLVAYGEGQRPVHNVQLLTDGREAAEVLIDTSLGEGV